jgi:hypothetical protein
MNPPLIAAGCLAIVAAGVHGGAGEVLVVRRIPVQALPSTRFGGQRTTMAMLQVSWHLVTVAFLTAGVTLLASGTFLDGDAARAVAWVGTAAVTGFAAVVVGLGAAATGTPRSMFRHPGPLLLSAVTALAWWGAL